MDKERLEREINILKNTFHYNIIKIYQVKETSTTLCMIMEYAEGGELFNYIIGKGFLSEDESREIFQQIIDAIYYLHKMGICHRDLKPENILFDTKDRKRIKIIDFGLSNLYIYSEKQCKDLLETPCGSPGYAPPEMIYGIKYDGLKTDIWSCGIILYAMLFGCLPFDDYDEEKLYQKIIEGKYEFPSDINVSNEAKDFINSILVVDPKYRANITDIKNNKWFLKNYNPSIGLFNSITEIPVSNLIVKEIVKIGFNKEKIINNIKNNNHNNLTTLYYLLVKKKLKKGIETESDLISTCFKDYMEKQITKLMNNNIKPISLKEILLNQKEKDKNKKQSVTYRENKKDLNINTEMNKKSNNNINGSNRKKNKTISKEKKKKKYYNLGINNININNIKNIHYININSIKSNILMKTFDKDGNNKLFKKIAQISKSNKEINDSNSKNMIKNSQRIKNINFYNKKVEKDIFINLNYFKIKKNFSRAIDIKNNIKKNKTTIEEPNKEINISINNNKNINTFTLENNKKINYNYKTNLNKKYNRNTFFINKLPTYSNFVNKLKYDNNLIRKMMKEKGKENYYSFLIKNRMKNLRIDSIEQLLNNLKSSRIKQSKYIMVSESNSRSKSGSNSKTKCLSSREKNQKNGFLFLNSRNYTKKSPKKIKENKLNNLTFEKLGIDLKKKNNNKVPSKEKDSLLKKKLKFKIKQKKLKEDLSKPKHISASNCIKIINDSVSNNNINHKKKINKILPINYLNRKTKNMIRNQTINLEQSKIKGNNKMNLSTKTNKNLSFAAFLRTNERKKNETNVDKNLKEKINKKNLNNKTNQKVKFSLNLKEKSRDNNKQSLLDNISYTINNIKTIDDFSREINDISNSKISSKKKSNNNVKGKLNKINQNNNKIHKKIKLGNSKPLKLKNLMLFQDLKGPYTYRKNQKFIDESLFK